MKVAIICLVLVAIAQRALGADSQACTVTVGDVLGPYYQAGAPVQKGYLCSHSPSLDRLKIVGQVQQADCATPLPAQLDVWQANEAGYYSEGTSRDSQDYLCRAVINTDERGIFSFQTRMPGRYDDSGYRPAHIHFKVTPLNPAYDPLVTQLYFQGDSYLGANDSCARCMSGNPTLQAKLVHFADIKTYEGTWNIVMKPRSAGANFFPQRVPTPLFDEHDEGQHSYTSIKPHIQVKAHETLLDENMRLKSKLRDAGLL